MAELTGFWSYAHSDDAAEKGRIVELANDLAIEYAIQTGDTVDLFVDRDGLNWGDTWKQAINSRLAQVAFFVPVLTPAFFRSSECKRELESFIDRTEGSRGEGIILPILYIDFLNDVTADAESALVEKCRNLQWEEFHELRFEERTSRAYRKKIAAMAGRLVEANRDLDRRVNEEALTDADGFGGGEDEDSVDEPGILEQLAEMETALPQLVQTLNSLTEVTDVIGAVTQQTMKQESSRMQGSFAERLQVSRSLANSLDEPSRKFMDLSSSYIEDFRSVDNGVKTLITIAEDDGLGEEGPKLFESVLGLAHQAKDAFAQISEFKTGVRQLRSWSRELSEPMRRIDVALDQILESVKISDEWLSALEGSKLLDNR